MTLTKYPIIVSFARKWRHEGFSDNTIDGYTYMLGKVADHLGGETELITATRYQPEEYLIGRRQQVLASAVAFDVDADAVEPGARPVPELDSGDGLLVGVNLGLDDSGPIVDRWSAGFDGRSWSAASSAPEGP